jgi:hypothetical protein
VAGVGDLHAGQRAHHALILEHGLKGSLRNLGLVGRVRRIKLATAEDIVDRRGNIVVIRARAKKAAKVVRVEEEWGKIVAPEKMVETLKGHPEPRSVALFTERHLPA